MQKNRMSRHLLVAILAALGLPCHISAGNAAIENATFDFIIVGAGNTGCVLANRLSQNGKYTVCLLEAGRDDARLPTTLPESSPAPVPQLGTYQWGKYVRGPATSFAGALINRGFGAWHFYEQQDANSPYPSKVTTYHRHSGWGGCTSHNTNIAGRNPPQTWDEWAALGLNEWAFDNISQYYFLVENRSQVRGATGVPYFSTSVPLGDLGSFDPAYYGLNGMVPLLYNASAATSAFTTTVLGLLNSDPTLSQFGYPNFLVDGDWPNRAALAKGGLTVITNTLTDQNANSTIIPPGGTSPVNVNQGYNPYGDGGFTYPSEWARLGSTGLVPQQRVSSANTYLYAAEGRPNLTIKSEVLVTKVILDSNNRARGVEYLEGWNIYQTGRNPDTGMAGYGGSRGDAKANSIQAKKNGTFTLSARKEVILCAGVFNTPQILMLSGIGDPKDLNPVGIKSKVKLTGVGKNLIDNQELFPFFSVSPSIAAPTGLGPTLTAKSNPNLGFPNFQLSLGIPGRQSLESSDPFVQKGWNGVRNTPGLSTSFNRNDFSNILLDPTNANANPVSGSPAFAPIMSDPTKFMGITVEQEENNRSSGYIQLLSNDPTVPPRIIFNYLQDPNDLQDWMDLWNNNILPLLLALRPSGYFQDLLFPSPADILVAPTISFTSMAQVDQVKLANFLKSHVGGHHAGGTCKMGVPSDPSAVVDQKGQVYGTQRLRICDASIFPTSIWWPNVGLYVIGEKISHDILTKYGN